jgi:hypothetical protein
MAEGFILRRGRRAPGSEFCGLDRGQRRAKPALIVGGKAERGQASDQDLGDHRRRKLALDRKQDFVRRGLPERGAR